MLEPWAEISERLRRIHPDFQTEALLTSSILSLRSNANEIVLAVLLAYVSLLEPRHFFHRRDSLFISLRSFGLNTHRSQ